LASFHSAPFAEVCEQTRADDVKVRVRESPAEAELREVARCKLVEGDPQRAELDSRRDAMMRGSCKSVALLCAKALALQDGEVGLMALGRCGGDDDDGDAGAEEGRLRLAFGSLIQPNLHTGARILVFSD
jgi:hypothetical protein